MGEKVTPSHAKGNADGANYGFGKNRFNDPQPPPTKIFEDREEPGNKVAGLNIKQVTP
jgi:hypothetical protein